MIAVLIRLALFALVIYLAARLLRHLFHRAFQRVGVAASGTPPEDAIYSGEVLLTGRLRVQVVSSGNARPLPGRRVSFKSCGFT